MSDGQQREALEPDRRVVYTLTQEDVQRLVDSQWQEIQITVGERWQHHSTDIYTVKRFYADQGRWRVTIRREGDDKLSEVWADYFRENFTRAAREDTEECRVCHGADRECGVCTVEQREEGMRAQLAEDAREDTERQTVVDFGEQRPGSSDPMPPERRAEYQKRIEDASKSGPGSKGAEIFVRDTEREHEPTAEELLEPEQNFETWLRDTWLSQAAPVEQPQEDKWRWPLQVCPACGSQQTGFSLCGHDGALTAVTAVPESELQKAQAALDQAVTMANDLGAEVAKTEGQLQEALDLLENLDAAVKLRAGTSATSKMAVSFLRAHGRLTEGDSQ